MTRDFHRPLTPKKLSQLAESVTQASALEPGLTMVVGPYSELVHFVYATSSVRLKIEQIQLVSGG